MATYAIGDVQGCFDGLLKLLKKINFKSGVDKLIFLGDVVNRGDKSLQTLKFIINIDAKIVLGNHDFYLLACYFGISKPSKKDTFLDILKAKNNKNLIEFLLSQKIVLNQNNLFFVHAGIPPMWDKNEVLAMSNKLQQKLTNNPEQFIKDTFGNQNVYNKKLSENRQMQYAINAFMRMRFCTKEGELEFDHKQNIASANFNPWFSYGQMLLKKNNIYFGHWSSLKSTQQTNLYPLDTGYIWGGNLSCIRIEDNIIFSIK